MTVEALLAKNRNSYFDIRIKLFSSFSLPEITYLKDLSYKSLLILRTSFFDIALWLISRRVASSVITRQVFELSGKYLVTPGNKTASVSLGRSSRLILSVIGLSDVTKHEPCGTCNTVQCFLSRLSAISQAILKMDWTYVPLSKLNSSIILGPSTISANFSLEGIGGVSGL